MKSWDVAVIGAGIIGLSLAWELRKRGVQVLVIERGRPGQEASTAAAGMIAAYDPAHAPELKVLAAASAGLYPEFVHQLRDESLEQVDFRQDGMIAIFPKPESIPGNITGGPSIPELSAAEAARLEPSLVFHPHSYLLPEAAVDPRQLLPALLKSAQHRGIDLVSGTEVIGLEVVERRAVGVKSSHTTYWAQAVVNCAGAWAGKVGPIQLPTRPVKGQMLALVFPHGEAPPPVPPQGERSHASVEHGAAEHGPGGPGLRHVIRAPCCYIVPRSSGKLIVGSTVEEAGFDKTVDPGVIQGLHQAAVELVPQLREARILEAWAGLRPGTPDGLPILGESEIAQYFFCTGHYRDGILLAPMTARIMASMVVGEPCEFELSLFSPQRFTR